MAHMVLVTQHDLCVLSSASAASSSSSGVSHSPNKCPTPASLFFLSVDHRQRRTDDKHVTFGPSACETNARRSFRPAAWLTERHMLDGL